MNQNLFLIVGLALITVGIVTMQANRIVGLAVLGGGCGLLIVSILRRRQNSSGR